MPLTGALDVLVIERCSEFQAGGVRELPFAGREADLAAYLHRPDEPLFHRAKHQDHALGRRFPADFDVLILAGTIESFDGIADVAQAQRRAGLKRHEAMQVRGRQRLQLRFETHGGNRAAFVILGERKIFGMRGRGAGEKEPTEQTPYPKGPICHMLAVWGKPRDLSMRFHI